MACTRQPDKQRHDLQRVYLWFNANKRVAERPSRPGSAPSKSSRPQSARTFVHSVLGDGGQDRRTASNTGTQGVTRPGELPPIADDSTSPTTPTLPSLVAAATPGPRVDVVDRIIAAGTLDNLSALVCSAFWAWIAN